MLSFFRLRVSLPMSRSFDAALAADPVTTGTVNQPAPSEQNVSSPKAADKCLGDLHAFDNQMEKDGYWLVGSGYGYGYPVSGSGFGYGYPMTGYLPATATGYQNARPGYEIRILVASAHVLARHGQQQPCEDVLATTREIYKTYVADLHNEGMKRVDMPGWRQQQIAAALPVTSNNAAFRSDQLLGTDVRTPKNEALGSVNDIVMSPQTGKIAYLVIAEGGIFGIDEKYVPVPWEDFKAGPNVNLLVLDTNKAAIKAAPQVSHDQFTTAGHFDQVSQKVDAYWKSHLSDNGQN
jgi:sporulation protein YlmC with PRC-barrel domain